MTAPQLNPQPMSHANVRDAANEPALRVGPRLPRVTPGLAWRLGLAVGLVTGASCTALLVELSVHLARS